MRLRVLGVLSLLSLLMVIGVSYALVTSASRELTQELQINRVSSLNRFAQLASDTALDDDFTKLQREMDRYSELYDEGIIIRLQDRMLRSGALDEDRLDVRNAVSSASLNLTDTTLPPLLPFESGSDVISRSFGSANQVLGEAVLEVNQDAARQKLRERWLAVGLGAAALEAVLLLLASRVTGWVLRPIHRLNTAVRELAATGKTSQLPEDGPPELRELSHSFTTMAETVTESIESQRQLIADTSHQLRNPVGALRLRIDLLELDLRNSKEGAAVTGVVDELERVEEILDGVLKLAAAEHRASEGVARNTIGQAAPHLEALIDPCVVLREEVERAGHAARLAGCRLVLDTPETSVELKCNATELAEMVGELLNNAIKYAPGALITARVRLLPRGLVIEIADDGPGLSEDERTASLGRFWRSPRHRHLRGNGLGMTIVSRLAGANGGSLRLSQGDPRGLVASLEFPWRLEFPRTDPLDGSDGRVSP
ncbi:HAMP domain-containing sensor histidine kinase [Arthrobacter rhizosphaerae]|uniref:HAMP domain-containing sensor histidine kinase n=1 Tax=Arthrobacter rhizosphaerae TaxID=2855490 RepID=UPI001FF1BD7B|nr:HAMP domain-containing sensor histidine kinase [Arthrobacter rhizosphaerae]